MDVLIEEPTPATTYMFCYTSGTTGDPKGAKITHESFISCCSIQEWFNIDLDETDISISYLPCYYPTVIPWSNVSLYYQSLEDSPMDIIVVIL